MNKSEPDKNHKILKTIKSIEEVDEHMKELDSAKYGTLILLIPYFEEKMFDFNYYKPKDESYITGLLSYLGFTSWYLNHSDEVQVEITLSKLLANIKQDMYKYLIEYGEVHVDPRGVIITPFKY